MSESSSRRFPLTGTIAFVALAVLLLTLAVLSTVKNMRMSESQGQVVSVQDGQTVVVNLNGTEETVRLAGLIAPISGDGEDTSLDHCLAEKSLDHLRQLLEPGEDVRLDFPDQREGPHGTVLAQVHHAGEIVNVQQVEEGLAVPVRDQPLAELGKDLGEAHGEARSSRKGLYSDQESCTLSGRVNPALKQLEGLDRGQPVTSEAAAAATATVEEAIERGTAAQKIIAAVEDSGTTVSSLAWAQDKGPLTERLGAVLASAQTRLTSLQNYEESLLAAEQRARDEAARQAEQARLREMARQQEIARQQQLARERAAAERAAEQRRQEEQRRRASASASASAPPSPSPSSSSATPSPSPSPTSESPSPSPSPSSSPAPSPTPSASTAPPTESEDSSGEDL